MGRAFAEITFTPSVKAAQSRYGSRDSNRGFEVATERQDELTEAEVQFIQQMDGFFQASIGETGWPYVQFRGGPRGFLKVIDSKTIGFADFRGNLQYLSVGNMNADGRVAIILMNHSNPSRLKIWGEAKVIDRAVDPELVQSLHVAGNAVKAERAIVIRVHAFDWNCPRHITPRFTELEIREMTKPLIAELAALRKSSTQTAVVKQKAGIGDGQLKLSIAGIRILTSRVRAYLLKAVDGSPLAPIEPGAHLLLPIRLPDGRPDTRRYSIASDPDDPTQWEIAVQREDRGLGGSAFIHSHYEVGTTLNCHAPRNGFELHADDRPAVLIAGGIGIAPLRSMAFALDRSARAFTLHYAARSPADAPYLPELLREFSGRIRSYWSEHGESARMDLQAIVNAAPPDAVFYVCGPERMLSGFQALPETVVWAEGRVRMERFNAPVAAQGDQSFEVQLGCGGRVLEVPIGKTILDVLLQLGEHPSYDCKVGTCGTCTVKVLQGLPDYRDVVLAQSERERDHLMCICVSRSAGGRLVLDM
jgi:ferredoxin-NADP reductase/predicted pyridoxine 5'-phosphate oxidase superfamily flavin-nucleotide-binding protein